MQGIFLLRFLTGASFAGPVFAGGVNYRLWVGAALCVCATLSVYILNGVMDVEEDRINGSSRPVASGKLTVAQAASMAAGLAVLSVAGSLTLGGPMVLSVVIALILGWLYSGPPWYLKRWPAGLATVAIIGGIITYQAGYAANGGGGDVVSFCVFAAVMALWMGLVGQTKDLSDIEGDKRAGRSSGPVAWGEGRARLIFSTVALSIGTTYLLLALTFVSVLILSAMILVAGAMAVAAVTLGPWSRGDRSRRRSPYRVFMLTQYGTNLTVLLY